MSDRFQQLRQLEALLFAAAEPQPPAVLQQAMGLENGIDALLDELGALYANRGVVLVKVGSAYAFRTAGDLGHLFKREERQQKRLSRAAVETLAIIAYHQPVTRAEIEEIRGVALSKGTLDVLLEAGWTKPGKRRETPGRPVTWVTTAAFLDHFGLSDLSSLPGLEELKAAGLLDSRPAITALSERGLLGPAGSDQEAANDGSEDPLEADFGEDLVPDIGEVDEEQLAEGAPQGEDSDGDGEPQPGSEELAQESWEEPQPHPDDSHPDDSRPDDSRPDDPHLDDQGEEEAPEPAGEEEVPENDEPATAGRSA